MRQLRTALLFDMRAPDFGAPTAELYAQALDMSAFADEIGMTSVQLMEHHQSEDGYLPQPFVMGGGVAARTKRCRIILGAVILPLHDPVKLAEEIAVLDLMSGGRLEVIFGAGYVASEFAAFNVSLHDRARLLDEGIDIILRALHGERFTVNGRPVYVRPLPIQKPEDILFVGGGVEASAKRAGRFGLGFSPMHGRLFNLYDAESRKHGHEPGKKYDPSGPGGMLLSRDPEATWPRVLPHLKHMVAEYAKMAAGEANSNSPFAGMLTDDDTLKRAGFLNIWTPEELVERAPAVIGPLNSLGFAPLQSGMSPEIGWESLRLLQSVMPQLHAA